MTAKEKKMFFRLMKEAKIFSNYLREVRENHNMRSTMVKKYGGDIKSFFEGERYGSAIDYAFIWDDSRLGYEFWEEVSELMPLPDVSYPGTETFALKIKRLLQVKNESPFAKKKR